MKRNLNSFSRDWEFSIPQKIFLLIWHIFQNVIFKSFLFPARFRPLILRLFGASIGTGVLIRRGVRIHLPWNLTIGNDCWIGEDVWFINHEKITISSNVCISQRSIICSGGHDYRKSSLSYAHKPVSIKDGAWICLDAKILPGVTIGECSVVSAGEIARKSIPNYSILINGQVQRINYPG